MDYAIYKSTDGKKPHVVHRFTQAACNHRALVAARHKMLEMWARVLRRDITISKATEGKDWFEYDYYTTAVSKVRLRFYIAPLKEDKLPTK